MTPLIFHGLQVAALIAVPLSLRGVAILVRPHGQNRLSPQRRAHLARYAASPARTDDTFTRRAPRAQQRMLGHLQAQRRLNSCLALLPLTTATALIVALALGGTPRGLWSAPYLALLLALAGARAARRWMSLQDVYLRARSEYDRLAP